MKQAKSTGALIVSLLLAVVLLGVTATGALTIGVQAYKASQGEGEMKDPGFVNDFAQDDEPFASGNSGGDVYAQSVELQTFTEGSDVYGVVTGTLSNGKTWEYETMSYPETELAAIEEIQWDRGLYIFNEFGTVTALDELTGETVWTNDEFYGQSISKCIDEDGTMYLCGYYGPDLHIIDMDGITVERIEVFDSEYYWPYSVTHDSSTGLVTIKFEQGPGGSEGAIAYNLNDSNFYAIDGKLTLASEMEPWQRSFMTVKIDDSMRDKYNSYGLVHIDNDGIPAMIARGSDARAVVWYDAASDSVMAVEFTGDGYIDFYPGTGLFAYVNSEYTDSESAYTTTYYRLSGGKGEKLAELWYRSYKDANDEYQYEYKHNGVSMESDEYFEKQSAIEALAEGVESMTPELDSSDAVDSYIMSWYDPSDDESVWKERFADEIEFREQYDGFCLADLNGDGVPELFMYDRESYGDFGYVVVCDVQTHQLSMTYTSADHVGRKPGTNMLFDTYFVSSVASDALYEVESYRVVKVEDGFRMVYSETDMDCYLDDEQVSMEEYVMAFSALLGENEYLIDSCVSYSEVLKQLQ